MNTQSERRKFVRLSPLVDVLYQKKDSTEKKVTLSKNISAGGICLIAYEELKKSDILELELFLPGDNIPIKAIGRVVWVNEFILGDKIGKRYDAGIEFIGVSNKDLDRINKFVFSRAL